MSMTDVSDDLSARLNDFHLSEVNGVVEDGHRDGDEREIIDRINILSTEISRLLNLIYEIEELRHSSQSNTSHSTEISKSMSTLNTSLSELEPKIISLRSGAGQAEGIVKAGLEGLLGEWTSLADQHAMLQEEMKDDSWVVRFRATADQAEAMMVPLQKSLKTCTLYVEKVQSSPVPVPYESDLEELPSISKLESLMASHDSMKKTYVPSIVKVLKMMERSIEERSTKNGEVLRRYSTMSQVWSDMQRDLHQLDARIRIIMAQHTPSEHSQEDIEVLNAQSSEADQTAIPVDYFGLPKNDPKRPAGSSRSSYTSNYHAPTVSSLQRSPGPSTLSPGTVNTPTLRRRMSTISNTSTSSSRIQPELPRWNASPRVVNDTTTTPRAKRISDVRSNNSTRSSMASPTPSHASVTSSVLSHPASRIPVPSPKHKSPTTNNTSRHIEVPALAVSTSHHQTFLSEGSRATSQSHLSRAREAMKTPDPSRSGPRVSMSEYRNPRTSLTPQLGARSVSGSTTPRSMPSFRPPPSSFRSNTPTPYGNGTSLGISGLTRPSSRLSTKSYSNYNPNIVRPFQPSPHDLLDKTVQGILDQVGFNLFVGRVDASMKRGQRRSEGEEWKGEYVFGAGERPVGVKLVILKPGPRNLGKKEGKVKCLARVGGAWVDLGGVLEGRMQEVLQSGESP